MKRVCSALRDRRSRCIEYSKDRNWSALMLERFSNGDGLVGLRVMWSLLRCTRLTIRERFAIVNHVEDVSSNASSSNSKRDLSHGANSKLRPDEIATLRLIALYYGHVKPLFSWDAERIGAERDEYEKGLNQLRTIMDMDVARNSGAWIRLEVEMLELQLRLPEILPMQAIRYSVDTITSKDSDIKYASRLLWLVVERTLTKSRPKAFDAARKDLVIAVDLLRWVVARVEPCKHCRFQTYSLARNLETYQNRLITHGHSETIAIMSEEIVQAIKKTKSRTRQFRMMEARHHSLSAELFDRTLVAGKAEFHLERLGECLRDYYFGWNKRQFVEAYLRIRSSVFARKGQCREAMGSLVTLVAFNGNRLTTIPVKALAQLTVLSAETGAVKIAEHLRDFIGSEIGDPPRDSDISFYQIYGHEKYELHVDQECRLGIALGKTHELLGSYWSAGICYEVAHFNARDNYTISGMKISTYMNSLLNRAICASQLGDVRKIHSFTVGILTGLGEGRGVANIRPDEAGTLLQGMSLHVESLVAWGNIEHASNLQEKAREYTNAFADLGYAIPEITELRLLRSEAILWAHVEDTEKVIAVRRKFFEICSGENWSSGLAGIFTHNTWLIMIDFIAMKFDVEYMSNAETDQSLIDENPQLHYEELIATLDRRSSEGHTYFDFQRYIARVHFLKYLVERRDFDRASSVAAEAKSLEELLLELGRNREIDLHKMQRLLAIGKLAEEDERPDNASLAFNEAASIALSREWEFPGSDILTAFQCAADFEFAQWQKSGDSEHFSTSLKHYLAVLAHVKHVRVQNISPLLRAETQSQARHTVDRLQLMALSGGGDKKIGVENLFAISEFARSRLLLDNLTILPPPNLATVPEDLFVRLNNHRSEIINYAAIESSASSPRDFEASPVADSSPPKPHVENYDAQQDLLFARNQFYDILRDVQRRDPGYDVCDPIETVDLASAINLLPDKRSIIVQYLVGNNGALALLISKRGQEIVKLRDCSTSGLQEILDDWNTSYDKFRNCTPDESSELEWSEQIDKCMRQISAIAIQPILQKLAPFDQIIFVPHMQLHVFPLHAAPCENGVLICDLFEITSLPSISIGARITDRQNVTSAQAIILNAGEESTPFSWIESKAIEKRMACKSVFSTFDESLYQISRKSTDAKYWHFIGHGEWDGSHPLASFLSYDVDLSSRWSSLSDVYSGLQLPNTEVVTLSACETAMKTPNSLDEFVSFPSAFLYAGARAVIGSHWIVSSLPTTLLMCRFYENIFAGQSVSESLRMAQKWLRGSDDFRGEALRSGRDLLEYFQDAFKELAVDAGEFKYWEACVEKESKNISPPFQHTSCWAAFSCHGIGWTRPESTDF